MLLEADTIQKAKELKSIALTAAEWAKRKNMGEAAIQHCRSYALEAERKMGQMLAATDRNKGAKPGKTGNKALPLLDDTQPTLADLGLTKRESAEAQMLAELPAEDFELLRSGKTTKAKIKKKRNLSAIKPLSAKRERDPNVEGVGEWVGTIEELSGRKFGTLYVDPPWKYSNQATRASTDNHYQTLTVDEIGCWDIASLAAGQSHLHLWVTNAFLEAGLQILKRWGFEFKSTFVWVKPQMGIGNYWRNSHEIMLLGVRGKLTAASRSEMSWLNCSRGKHSSKPDEVRSRIEKLSPGPYLELFGRRRVQGWTVLGNQETNELI